MSQQGSVDALCQLSTKVTEKERKIWELQTRNQCIKSETERLDREIEHINKRTQELKNEDIKLETLTVQLSQSIRRQQTSSSINNNSLAYHKLLKLRLSDEAKEFKNKYIAVLAGYNKELRTCRQKYESTSNTFKWLRSNQVEVKKLEFQWLWLKTQIERYEKIYKTFEEIQRKRFQATIVKFTYTYKAYKDIENFMLVLQGLKAEQKALLKEHWELQNEVKELSNKQMNMKKNVVQSMGDVTGSAHVYKRDKQTEEQSKPPEDDVMECESSDDVGQLFSQTLHAFINEGFKSLPLTSLSLTTPEERVQKFNETNSKVRILDVKVFADGTKMKNAPLPKNLQSDLAKVKYRSEIAQPDLAQTEVNLNNESTKNCSSGHELKKLTERNRSEKEAGCSSTLGLRQDLEGILRQETSKSTIFKRNLPLQNSQEAILLSQSYVKSPDLRNENICCFSQDQSKIFSLKEGSAFKLSQDNSKTVLQICGNGQEDLALLKVSHEKPMSQENRELRNLNLKPPSNHYKKLVPSLSQDRPIIGNQTISKFFDNKKFFKKSVSFQNDVISSNLDSEKYVQEDLLKNMQNEKSNEKVEEEKIKKTVTFKDNTFTFLAMEDNTSFSEKEITDNSIYGSTSFKSPDLIALAENSSNEGINVATDFQEAFIEDNLVFDSDSRIQPAEDKSDSQTFKTFSFGRSNNKNNVFSMF